MKVLILGHKGMLGNAVVNYFHNQNVEVSFLNSRYPTNSFFSDLESYDGDYIINCVASIPQRTKDFEINYKLPEYLTTLDKKIIHPDTDCIFNGKANIQYKKYDLPDADSEYGKSKIKALTKLNKNTKIIRTCIVGLDQNNKSLLSWFLNSKENVNGFTNHFMNCITTHEWAKICYHLCLNWSCFEPITQVGTECMSKYNFLLICKDIFNKNIDVLPHNHKEYIYRCLETDINVPSIELQLEELKEVYQL